MGTEVERAESASHQLGPDFVTPAFLRRARTLLVLAAVTSFALISSTHDGGALEDAGTLAIFVAIVFALVNLAALKKPNAADQRALLEAAGPASHRAEVVLSPSTSLYRYLLASHLALIAGLLGLVVRLMLTQGWWWILGGVFFLQGLVNLIKIRRLRPTVRLTRSGITFTNSLGEASYPWQAVSRFRYRFWRFPIGRGIEFELDAEVIQSNGVRVTVKTPQASVGNWIAADTHSVIELFRAWAASQDEGGPFRSRQPELLPK